MTQERCESHFTFINMTQHQSYEAHFSLGHMTAPELLPTNITLFGDPSLQFTFLHLTGQSTSNKVSYTYSHIKAITILVYCIVKNIIQTAQPMHLSNQFEKSACHVWETDIHSRSSSCPNLFCMFQFHSWYQRLQCHSCINSTYRANARRKNSPPETEQCPDETYYIPAYLAPLSPPDAPFRVAILPAVPLCMKLVK